MLHDKKSVQSGVTVVRVPESGRFELESLSFEKLFAELDSYISEVRKK